ncbi:hypothetical protein [Labilithrix luteola]|uniref:GspE/PulE/PilB domain-containing protein n=1 Tax=Labilithrix luteola TaxID=1391654 RepID=UPI001F0A272C|nr:hypothetical protein [Labilithrix luteola]
MIGDPSAPPMGGEVMPRRVPLGELLIQAKVITQEQLAEVLASPREPGKKMGQLLIERGWLSEAQLTQTLSLQLSVPWVSLYHIDFSRQLLNRVSRDLAERYCLIPIFVRHVKGQGETLYVAMDDPTNEGALSEVSKQAALPARPMIASASDIRSAIRVYYGEPSTPQMVEMPLSGDVLPTTVREGIREGRREVAPPVSTTTPAVRVPSQPPPAPRRSSPPPPLPARAPKPPSSDPDMADAAPPTTRSTPPSAAAPPPENAPVRPAVRESRPDEGTARRRGGKMVALTLLDGTTINLPSRASRKEAFGPQEGLTARDFISALRASSQGADAAEVLGEKPQWEPVVAALLSILLRKGLIADWEFVEELRKI